MYKLRYLPLFETDLYEAASYISNVLKNPKAAERLLTETEKAIAERLKMPLSFEPYRSIKERCLLSDICRKLYGFLCGD